MMNITVVGCGRWGSFIAWYLDKIIYLQSLMDQFKQYNIQNKIIVLCMKGLEANTGRRLSQIASDAIDFTMVRI